MVAYGLGWAQQVKEALGIGGEVYNKLVYGAIRLPFLIKSSSPQIPAYLQEWHFMYANNTSNNYLQKRKIRVWTCI